MPSTENKENEQLQQQEEGKSLLMSSTTTTSPNKNSSKSRNNDFYGAIDSSSKNSNSSDRSDGNTRKNKRDAAPVTYLGLLSSNRNFRYYWLSYVVNRMGDWMTYLASIALIEDISSRNNVEEGSSSSSSNNKNTLISILILVKLLPNVFAMPLGGILADSYDRRKVQIVIDVASAFVVIVFLWSVYAKSITLCYAANFLQEVLTGLYGPSNNSIVPQLVNNYDDDEDSEDENSDDDDDNTDNNENEELKKATTLCGLTWSLMAAIGSSLGGVLVAVFGIKGCFMIDSVTYLVSASFLYFGVQGNYDVTKQQQQQTGNIDRDDEGAFQPLIRRSSSFSINDNLIVGSHGAPINFTSQAIECQKENDDNKNDCNTDNNTPDMSFVRGLKFAFVEQPLIGAYSLLKGSGALCFGAADVLNVVFSGRGSEDNPSKTSFKLGLLFGFAGVGCIIGATLCDTFANLSYPTRVARLSIVGYSSIAIGSFLMAAFPNEFSWICLSGLIRANGSSLVWINSTLLVQKFTPSELLGRVMSIDTSVALFAQAISALGGGLLMDSKLVHVSPELLSCILGALALFFFFFWSPLAFKSPTQQQQQK